MSTDREPNFDVAQLAHTELLTPDPEGTLWFFKELLGMQETVREGQSVYLRAYEEFYHHSLKVTEAPEPGLGHVAWRSSSRQALDRRVASIESSGLGRGWSDGDLGHGPAYQFSTPDGHSMEILWEVDYWQAPEELRTPLINRPQKRPLTGVPVRRLDHVNLMASDVTTTRDFMTEHLGFRVRENIMSDDDTELGAWLSVSVLAHEMAIMRDATGNRGRFHHLCYWYGIPQHNSDAAEVLIENGIKIEAGPGKHGITQALFMYVFEPGGNRVELFGDAGYMIFDPEWKTVTWRESQLETGIVFYGSPLPEEFFLYGTPVVERASDVPPDEHARQQEAIEAVEAEDASTVATATV
jgi:catechol 2,3-dioxygenase